MRGNPHQKGYCMRVFTEQPKKPNSGKRWVARIMLFRYKKKIVAKIGGQGKAGLERFKKVLVRAGKVRDLIGVKNVVIRGVYNAEREDFRKRMVKRQKYGVKNYEKYLLEVERDKRLEEGRITKNVLNGDEKQKIRDLRWLYWIDRSIIIKRAKKSDRLEKRVKDYIPRKGKVGSILHEQVQQEKRRLIKKREVRRYRWIRQINSKSRKWNMDRIRLVRAARGKQ